MGSLLSQPSPSDWDRWTERLLNGEEPSEAARAERQTCTAFRRVDPARHAECLALSREIRAGEDREYVRQKLRENVEQAMRAVPVFDKDGEPTGEYTYRGDYANKALELLGRSAAMFDDTQRVELTGAQGGPVAIEGRAVVGLADVVRLAAELGVGHLVGVDAGDPRGELAAAGDVLPGTSAR